MNDQRGLARTPNNQISNGNRKALWNLRRLLLKGLTPAGLKPRKLAQTV